MRRDRDWARKLLSRIREFLGVEEPEAVRRLSSLDPFKLLVATVLSQNTSDRNAIAAYEKLERRVGIAPDAILRADPVEVEDAIRIAGLYRQRAAALREIAKAVVERYGGDLRKVLRMPLEEARRELLSLPKVGYKTADIVLLFAGGQPIFPVDTHISRISRRLGLVEEGAGYEDIRRAWEELLDPREYAAAHLLLIEFGRRVCSARRPLCGECPVSDLCPSSGAARGKPSR